MNFPAPDPLSIVAWFDPNGGDPVLRDAWGAVYWCDSDEDRHAALHDAARGLRLPYPRVAWPWTTPEELHYNKGVNAYYYKVNYRD